MEKLNYNDVYPKHVIELYKNPSNFGLLENPSFEVTEYDSACGDEITVQLLVKDGKIINAKFSGSGCVLSTVVASLLTEKIKGMKIKDVKNLDKDDIKKLFGAKINPARIKCALLPLEATKKALK
ncbi:MAG TPA: iron-sulfur cluster assembly scaffold protein [Bacillota bacterium]|nr:iron-sulfur cluster assembly scaffold protein [Bacillota bacterium]